MHTARAAIWFASQPHRKQSLLASAATGHGKRQIALTRRPSPCGTKLSLAYARVESFKSGSVTGLTWMV
jgi:hypothetical protein